MARSFCRSCSAGSLNIIVPEAFSVGGLPPWLLAVSAFVLAVGVVAWAWSVLLILTNVRAGELVTTGPYSLVKHPLYTSVALPVLPWLGFLFDTWLGAVVGIALYAASRLFAPAEEAELADRFGALLGWMSISMPFSLVPTPSFPSLAGHPSR